MPFPTKTFRFDQEAKCLTGGFHEALRRLPKEKWRVMDLSGEHTRVLVRLTLKGRAVLIGPITGTVFDVETGNCLSGRAYLVEPVVEVAWVEPKPTVRLDPDSVRKVLEEAAYTGYPD